MCFQEEYDVTLIMKTCVFNLKCVLGTGKCKDLDMYTMDTTLV